MKNIQQKKQSFQQLYASRFVSAVMMIAALEIYILFMVIFGGAR